MDGLQQNRDTSNIFDDSNKLPSEILNNQYLSEMKKKLSSPSKTDLISVEFICLPLDQSSYDMFKYKRFRNIILELIDAHKSVSGDASYKLAFKKNVINLRTISSLTELKETIPNTEHVLHESVPAAMGENIVHEQHGNLEEIKGELSADSYSEWEKKVYDKCVQEKIDNVFQYLIQHSEMELTKTIVQKCIEKLTEEYKNVSALLHLKMIQADGDNHQTVIQTVADEMLREDDEKTIQLYLEETIIYIYKLYSFVQNIIENGALAFMRTRFVLYIYNQLKKQKNEENLNKYKSQYKKQEEKCEQDKINPAHSNNKQNESEEMSIENDKKRNMGNDANSYAVRTNNRINTDGDADLAQGIKYTTDNVPGKVKNLKEERNGENFNKYQYEEKQPREKSGGMKSICKLPGTILLRKHENEKTCNAALAENSKPLVLVILDTETLRQSLDDFFESDQNKKIIGVIMQLLTHGYGRFRQSRLSLLPLTHTEMNKFLDMNIDLNRLSTFTDWPNKSISSLHLAKAGFIYMGEGQEVSCFSCGLTISKFPEEFTPLDFHRTNGNNCNFLQSLDMNNNILNNSANEVQRNDKTQSQLKNTNSRTDQSRNDANKDLDSILTTDISDMGYQNGFVASNNMQPTIDKHTGNDGRSLKDSGSVLKNNLIKNETNNEVINYENRHENNSLTWSVDNYTNLNDNILGSAKHRQFIGIQNRLASFRGWSHKHVKEPKVLVDAGFYYTGKEDIVRCFFCDIGLAEWTSEDDPWVEHARHSPKCLFVIEKWGQEFIANIQTEWRKIYCPKNTEYEELDARIRSFNKSPSSIKQKSEQLASAGFFYTGNNDSVKCHYCNGGLRGWEEGDEPWTEHARWFPYCKFLVKMKGFSYVEEIAEQHNNKNFKGSANVTDKDNQLEAEPRTNAETSVNGIDSKAAEQVLKMGVSEKKVIDAINEHTRKTGLRIFTTEDLLDIIYKSDDHQDGIVSKTTQRANIEPPDIQALRLKKEHMYKKTMLCVRCKSAERCIMFDPCGHRLVCKSCSKTLKQCLKCKKNIKKCYKTYLS